MGNEMFRKAISPNSVRAGKKKQGTEENRTKNRIQNTVVGEGGYFVKKKRGK